MKKYHYILLDWDGNLAKTLDVWLHACKTALEMHGITKTDKEIGHSFGQFEERMAEWGIKNIDEISVEADAQAFKMLPDVELYPDALYVIEELKKRGKKLALITTSTRDQVLPLLKKHGLEETFDAVVTYDDVEHRKPHPEPLNKALELLGGNPSNAIMVGDTDKDVGAANAAGVDSILFYPAEHEKFYDINHLKYDDPTHIIDDFVQVLEIVG
jgi:pyrophosphatase PpaX